MNPRPNPLDLCWRTAGDLEDGGKMLRALARKLADDGLRDQTVREVVTLAAEKHLPFPPPDEEIEVVVRIALKAAAEARGVPMGPVDIATEEGRNALLQSRMKRQKHVDSPLGALDTYVACTLRVLTWNPHTKELDAETQEGTRLQLPIGADTRALQVAVGAVLGSLTSYAQRAHPKCTGADVLRVLWDRVKGTAVTDMSADDSLPVRLARTLLSATVWVTREYEDGMRTRQASERFVLHDRPGLYPTCGVGLLQHPELGAVLFVNLEKAAVEVLRSHPDFRTYLVRDLSQMLSRCPGYQGTERSRSRDKAGVERWRVERWHRVVLAQLPEAPVINGEAPNMTSIWEDQPSSGPSSTDSRPSTQQDFAQKSVPSVPNAIQAEMQL